MQYADFEERAWRLWEEIPEHYKQGVDGLVVRRRAVGHRTLPDIYTLGECITETYPSDFGGPETLRSYIALYHGSFAALAHRDAAFDWEHELWETMTHELQHHLESLATEDSLEGVDYAADENFHRLEGDEFDPEFYRSGVRLGDGLYQVEDEYFLELSLPARGSVEELEFEFMQARYAVTLPEHTGEVCFLEILDDVGLETGLLTLVLLRPRSFGSVIGALLRRRRPDVVEAEAHVRPVTP